MKEFFFIVGVAFSAVGFIAFLLLVTWALQWSPWHQGTSDRDGIHVVVKLQDWRR